MKQTILITGASSGIGRATAQLFADKGWHVIATMRSLEKAGDLATVANVTCLTLDVTKSATIKQALQKTIETYGHLDVIVNNAGYPLVGPFETTTEELVEKELQTNVLGVMNVTREVLPYFRKQKKGTIINIASMGGRVTFPLYSVYHASKWAVEGFSESLQHELRDLNIKIKIIEPGTIQTDFYGRSMHLTEKTGLHDYDIFVKKAMPHMLNAGNTGSAPVVIAELIYQAATDTSWRLRYAGGKNARLALTLRRLLPDSAFNWFIRKLIVG